MGDAMGNDDSAPDGGTGLARRGVLRDALAVGAAVAVFGLAYGAAATTAGLSWPQASALSLLTFTGASQFALVSVLGAGGGAVAAVAVSVFLGLRNGLYGLRVARLLPAGRLRRALAAHLVIDETMAMAAARDDPDLARFAFWATGISVFVQWNLATVAGALGAVALGDPRVIGFDAVFPAAFLALLAPLLRDRDTSGDKPGGKPGMGIGAERGTAVLAVVVTVTLVAAGTPAGLPILASALAAVPALWLAGRRGRAA
jgi:branched chain amino acid efflux pump